MSNDILYRFAKPDIAVADFVAGFWFLQNNSGEDKDVIILPDGRIDLIFSKTDPLTYHSVLLGLETRPDRTTIKARTQMFAISFKLLATEYILQNTVSGLLDSAKTLPPDFWGFHIGDLNDFDFFCQKASRKIQSLLPIAPDGRKQKLFDLVYASNGSVSVRELSEKVYWSSRQINRYFNRQFGLSLKNYCSILRFRASFQHIKEGKLFPEKNFTDQSHFIKEVKKLSGALPKELSKNQNDRFIQFSTLEGE